MEVTVVSRRAHLIASLVLLCFGCPKEQPSAPAAPDTSRPPWDAFLDNPSEATYAELREMYWRHAVCAKQGLPDIHQRTRLFARLQEGSCPAFRASLLVRECWGQPVRGEFHRNAGVLLERNALCFLQELEAWSVPNDDAREMVTSFPPGAENTTEAKLAQIEQRLVIAGGVPSHRAKHYHPLVVEVLEETRAKHREQLETAEPATLR